jgi:transposase
MKFIPGTRYIYASSEERASLVFPTDWDLSEIEELPDNRKPGRPAYDGEDVNRLYGDIWLLEQVADKTGIRQDLEKVFGSKGTVDDIMTLAMFPYLTKYSFNRVARWQRIAKSPSGRELTPPLITRLTQAITEKHRMELLALRASRLDRHELCAVDSTTRSAYGSSLADIKWGKNKDGLPLEQTVEVVVYTLDTHMPVYYRTFPGNMQDSRSLETILTDLAHAGFRDVILVTDRGYEKIRNLERYIMQGQAMIMCTKVQQKYVLDKILAFGSFNTRPDAMEIDKETRLYYQQYDIEYNVEGKGESVKKPDRLKLNLYFDVLRRGEELVDLEINTEIQREQLEALKHAQTVLDDDATLKRMYSYFRLKYAPHVRTLESYELNEKKVEKAKQTSGFFAIMTHKLDMAAMEVFHTYRLRDEQEEKCFQQMKSQMGGARQRNWSEEGKTGRLFIQFVSLILSSYARYIWRSTALKDMFLSSLEVLDEMRPIRFIEHTGRAKFITPFVGGQIDICDAFGFKIPEGCSPDYASKRKSTKRRGRPRKKVVERDL